MSFAQFLENIGWKVLSPIAYFGTWNKHRMLCKVGGCTFKVRGGTSDKAILWEVFIKNEYGGNDEFAIRPSDTVVDIGGHIGSFTVFAAKRAKRVYAYEALKENYDLLRENVALNGVKNAKLFNVAISDKVGKKEFFIADENFGGSSFYRKSYSKKRISVPTTTLERVFSSNNLKRINFLKMDIEGGEYDVLLHAKPSLLKRIDRITLEFHDNIPHGHTYHELVDVLERSGFKVSIPTSSFILKIVGLGNLNAIRIPSRMNR